MGRFERSHSGLGLLELGPQIGVVQTNEDIAGMNLLPRLEVDFHDAGQQFRADGGLMHGADRAHGRLVKRPANQTHRLELDMALKLRWPGGGRRRAAREPLPRNGR